MNKAPGKGGVGTPTSPKLTTRKPQGESGSNPDGELHPWGKFLAARLGAIDWLYSDGYDNDEIARILSMDEQQVRMIRERNWKITP